MKCRNCNKKIIKFLSLGKLPHGNAFLKHYEIPFEKRYDLSVGFCPSCYLVQLLKTIPPDRLYRKTFYLPSLFESIIKESKERAYYLVQRLDLHSKSLVLEIGSNDGLQLYFFQKIANTKILGVDPSKNAAAIARKRGVPTITEFFDYSLAKKLKERQKFGFDLILGINVLNHIPKIRDFLKGIKLLLKPKGTVFFKFLIQREIDIIQHEHVFYFSLLSLRNLLKNANLEIYDAEVKMNTLSIFISHSDVFPISKKVKRLIKEELEKNLTNWKLIKCLQII